MKPKFIHTAAVFILSMTSYCLGSTTTLTKSGIAIDAGSIGKFTLSYPSLTAGGTPSSAEVSANTADLLYSNGAAIHVTLKDSGEVTCALSNLPTETKNFRMDLTLPESLKGAAKWSMDDSEAKELPLQKVDGAFLFKNNAKKFTISGVKQAKDGFTISIPSGWMQLQDNRFWNGHEFSWFTSMDIPASEGKANLTFNLADGAGEAIMVKAAPLNLLAVKLTDKGVVVSNGTAGELTIALPSFMVGTKAVTSTEATVAADAKSVDLKYPGGATGHIALAAKKELAISFADLPKGTVAFRMDALIPLDYANGGTYSIGGGLATAFPKDKPASPFLYQDNANNITLVHPTGPDLLIKVPDYSTQQLQDNREWNWATFSWWMSAPIAPDQSNPTFTIKFEGGNTAA